VPTRVTAPTGYPTFARRRGVVVAASHATAGRQCCARGQPRHGAVWSSPVGPHTAGELGSGRTARAGHCQLRAALAAEAQAPLAGLDGSPPPPPRLGRLQGSVKAVPATSPPAWACASRRRFLDSSRSSVYDRRAVLENRFSNRPHPTGVHQATGSMVEGACQMRAARGHTSS
jgi:hypothetical protein